jgi:hypothetical protein
MGRLPAAVTAPRAKIEGVLERGAGSSHRCETPSRVDKMLGSIDPSSPPEAVAHIIQVALAPVFLLSGIATLLSVFSNRLACVADRVDQLSRVGKGDNELKLAIPPSELTRLHHRSVALDCAVVLGALAAIATCASVLTLFIGTLKNATIADVLVTTFGLALIFTLGAIGCFAVEMLMTTKGVRAEVASNIAKP